MRQNLLIVALVNMVYFLGVEIDGMPELFGPNVYTTHLWHPYWFCFCLSLTILLLTVRYSFWKES